MYNVSYKTAYQVPSGYLAKQDTGLKLKKIKKILNISVILRDIQEPNTRRKQVFYFFIVVNITCNDICYKKNYKAKEY